MPEQEVSPKYKLSGSRRWDLCFQLGAESMGASARETHKIPIITRFWKGGVPQIATRLQTLPLPTSIKKNKNKKLNPTVPSPYLSSLCKEGKNQGISGTKKNEWPTITNISGKSKHKRRTALTYAFSFFFLRENLHLRKLLLKLSGH